MTTTPTPSPIGDLLLREALVMASTRLARLALECSHGSNIRHYANEWSAEARSVALAPPAPAAYDRSEDTRRFLQGLADTKRGVKLNGDLLAIRAKALLGHFDSTPPPVAPEKTCPVCKGPVWRCVADGCSFEAAATPSAQPWAPVTDDEVTAMRVAFSLANTDKFHAMGNALLALRGSVAQGVVVDEAMVDRATAIVLGEGIHDTDTLRRVIASALDAALAPQQTEGGR